MLKINAKVTNENNFFQNINPFELIKEFGSPLYVYNERIIRERCSEIKKLVDYKNYVVNYSAKANSNLAFLQIIKSEGFNVDAMSPGEIYSELAAGFASNEILFISNNASESEMRFAIDNKVTISLDSVAQLEKYGKLNKGGKAALRFNPGIGAGHSEKVVTGGKNTKFGIGISEIDDVKRIAALYNLTIIGINQHIGSLFMSGEAYVASVSSLLDIATNFSELEFIDLGGGFGIPYRKQEGEKRLDLSILSKELTKFVNDFIKNYGREIMIKVEPGRYLSAESSVLLGEVNSIKINTEKKYIGTDLGFNVLIRPTLYDAHHDVEIYRNNDIASSKNEKVNIVGNICESGDYIAKDRILPEIFMDDIIGVLDTGAYSHVMSSNYNNRPRPAEVLIRENSQVVLIRKRDTNEDMIRNFIKLSDNI